MSTRTRGSNRRSNLIRLRAWASSRQGMTSNEAALVEMCNGELVTPEKAQAISQAVMAPIDALPAPFRKLVHEYGRNVTLAIVESGVKDEIEAEFQLRSNRWHRQEQWLKTD